jgi:hypothetical protein
MIRHVVVGAALVPALFSSVPLAQSPVPPPDPTYDARFVVEQAVEYVGTTTFAVGSSGEARGQLVIAAPLEGTGVLSGAVKDGTWAARIEFTLGPEGCKGVVSGTATVPADARVVTGTATITSTCVANQQAATFTFTRR